MFSRTMKAVNKKLIINILVVVRNNDKYGPQLPGDRMTYDLNNLNFKSVGEYLVLS